MCFKPSDGFDWVDAWIKCVVTKSANKAAFALLWPEAKLCKKWSIIEKRASEETLNGQKTLYYIKLLAKSLKCICLFSVHDIYIEEKMIW